MKILAPCDKFRAVDSNGDALVGGLVYTSTTGADWPANALATYTDATGNSANTNPIVLDARGEADIFLTNGVFYRFVLKTAGGSLIRTVDRVGYDYASTGENNTYTKANRGAYVALTSTSNSIAVDLNLSNNYKHTMTESTTLAAPSNIVAGQSGCIEITQHASSAKTLAYNAFWKWAAGTPGTISATLSSKNVICYLVDSGGTFATCTMNAAVA